MMEPMNVGSAPSSPSSPGAMPAFLPAFLMGEHQPASPSTPRTPEYSRNFSYSLSSPAEPGTLSTKLFSGPTETITSPALDVSVEKLGPPKQGLFDTLEMRKPPNTPTLAGLNKTFTADSPSFLDKSRSAVHNFGFLDDSIGSCETSRVGSSANLWVTVFGFPPSCASMVLARFSTCGTIVEKRFPSQGNWVHLKFNTPYEAARALALNGKLISNCIMVGVVMYQDKQSNKENADVAQYTSPARCRSLRQSYSSPQNSSTVLLPQNVPQKSTGLVTKAMEYVFGW